VDKQQLDLGLVDSFTAKAFGEPGQRTFRVQATAAEGSVSMWLEKEQIVMLASAIGELLERVPEDLGTAPQAGESRHFVGDLEVQVGALGIGFDQTVSGFTLEASELMAPLELSAIRFVASRQQLVTAKSQLDDIVAKGRPRCILCGSPLTDGPHFCPQSNGHAQTATPESSS
jgi:uncharacterized repeat protein (TIGR03847 family)